MREHCPSGPELERAYADRDPAAAAHVRRCPRCREEWREMEELRALLIPRPGEDPRAERLGELRAEVLALAAPAPRRRWVWPAAGAAMAAAILLLVVLPGRRSPAPPSPAPPAAPQAAAPAPAARARVVGLGAADFTHATEGEEETLVVRAGSVSVELADATGRPFLLQVPGAEHYLTGAQALVVVAPGRPSTIDALAGRLRLRDRGGRILELEPGQRLRVGEAAEAPAVVRRDPAPRRPGPGRAAAPPRPRGGAARAATAEEAVRSSSTTLTHGTGQDPTPAGGTGEEVALVGGTGEAGAFFAAYQQAFALLRAEEFGAAAAAFARAERAAAAPEEREDAAFFTAVALGRAADPGREAALERFLADHPRSSRAGLVWAMLGWRRLERGDRAGARSAFLQASSSPDLEAQESARAGLDELREAGR